MHTVMRPETTRQLEYRSSKLNALSFICTLQKKQTIIAERTYSCVAQASPGKSTLLRPGAFPARIPVRLARTGTKSKPTQQRASKRSATRCCAIRHKTLVPCLRCGSQNVTLCAPPDLLLWAGWSRPGSNLQVVHFAPSSVTGDARLGCRL
jgi:hypothetical protein